MGRKKNNEHEGSRAIAKTIQEEYQPTTESGTTSFLLTYTRGQIATFIYRTFAD